MLGKYSRDYIEERLSEVRDISGVNIVLYKGSSIGIYDKNGEFRCVCSGTGDEQRAYAQGMLDVLTRFSS